MRGRQSWGKMWWAAIAALLLAGPAAALTIIPTYDVSITTHPQGATIMNTINAAISAYDAKIIDNVTVNITFFTQPDKLGNSSTYYQIISYSSYLAAIRNRASSLDDAVALNQLPDGPGNPVNGNPNVRVSNPLARALGFNTPQPQLQTSAQSPHLTFSVLHGIHDDAAKRARDTEEARRMMMEAATSPSAVTASSDASIYLNVSACRLDQGLPPADKYSLYAVVSHEIDEVLGSSSILTGLHSGDPAPTTEIYAQDLFRYDPRGNRSFNTNANDTVYFSIDRYTPIVRTNQNAGGDFSDFWSDGVDVHVQDAYQTSGTNPAMDIEWRMLDVLGWRYTTPGVWVDFNYGGLQFGLYDQPYNTLAGGINAAPNGGLVLIKGGGLTTERPNLTKPLTFTTVGGTSTIGN